jgi:L-fuconolactonase
MKGRVDAHQHFWVYSPEEFGWIASDSVLARSYGPQDLLPLLAAEGMAGTVAVQARQTETETRWLLQMADEHPWIVGVVGWIDLRAPDLDMRLRALAHHPKLSGFRHVVQDEPDPRFLLDAGFQRGVRAVLASGLTYELLVRAPQLDHVPAFLDALGEVPEVAGKIVIDHGAKPAIVAGEWEPWAGRIAAIARRYPVTCKLSGLVTEADHQAWREDEVMRYMQHLLDCFGPERLMFGSDWPVCLLATSYERVHDLARRFLEPLAEHEREAIMGGNARRVYARDPGRIDIQSMRGAA